jgi:hypothetical protein
VKDVGRKIGKRICVSNNTYNFSIEKSNHNQATGIGKRMNIIVKAISIQEFQDCSNTSQG